jgi:Fic family protein
MASSNEKLASALADLRQLQANGSRVFASEQLSRTSRERLLENGFVQEVIKGWLVSSSPSSRAGDTTPWFSSFWEFCSRYCEHRFGERWFLSPDDSLLLHAEKTSVPRQVLISSPRGNNKRIELAYGTSFFALKKDMPPQSELVIRDGLRMYSVEAALVRVTEAFFRQNPIEAQVVLQTISEPSALLGRLLDGGHTIVAGRLAGAFRRIDRSAIADELVGAMKSAGHSIRESDPFEDEVVPNVSALAKPAFVGRLQTLWAKTRDAVLQDFPVARDRTDAATNLSQIDEIYELDAYHSLSIEGYVVSAELIERVASGAWDPENVPEDRDNKDALAARGYWLAFQAVREVIEKLLTGGDIALLRSVHRDWYRQLFAPHVTAGLINASALAGYRTQPVFLRGSRHVPPRAAIVGDAMAALFDLIESEPSPAVRATLGHWLLGYIHPFPDGNGRIARFVMNALLVQAGYPWTVIRVEDRAEYLAALEVASVDSDVRPFAAFVGRQIRASTTTEVTKKRTSDTTSAHSRKRRST